MEAGGDANAFQRLFFDEPLSDKLDYGHLAAGPFDTQLAG
jgi:hypothetical protein